MVGEELGLGESNKVPIPAIEQREPFTKTYLEWAIENRQQQSEQTSTTFALGGGSVGFGISGLQNNDFMLTNFVLTIDNFGATRGFVRVTFGDLFLGILMIEPFWSDSIVLNFSKPLKIQKGEENRGIIFSTMQAQVAIQWTGFFEFVKS